jgi:RNA polymerase sigma-70 factor (sigma-E family)
MATMALGLSRTDRTAEDPLAALHRDHYRSLVRLAAVLLGDVGRSEEVVQDAFVRLQTRLGGLRRVDAAPAYLRSAVLNGARSQLRRQHVRDRHAARPAAPTAAPSAEATALLDGEHDRVMHALRQLPERQREALALRYYLDLSEAEMAAAMGIAAGSVKTHLHRGLASLAGLLEEDDR